MSRSLLSIPVELAIENKHGKRITYSINIVRFSIRIRNSLNSHQAEMFVEKLRGAFTNGPLLPCKQTCIRSNYIKGYFLQFFSGAPIPAAGRSPAYLTGDFGPSALLWSGITRTILNIINYETFRCNCALILPEQIRRTVPNPRPLRKILSTQISICPIQFAEAVYIFWF